VSMKKIVLFLVVISLIGCVSLQQQYYNSAEDVIGLINDGKADELSSMTQTPFLLDGEIIILDNDMKDFWKNILKAGFRVKNPTIVEPYPVGEDTYKEFAKTMEVESYFKKYVSKKGHVIVVETEKFKLLLIMDKTKKNKTKIIGFKGPEAL
jgi:hypothetical protein